MKHSLSLITSVLAIASICSCERLDPTWQGGREDFTGDYHFYYTMGTMPTLYAGMLSLANEQESYMYYSRVSTFDGNKFPSHVHVYDYDLNTGNPNAGDDENLKAVAWMKSKIQEINEKHPDATFCIYMDDFRARIGYYWFATQGIDLKRVKVTMLSDGTGTYNDFYERFGKSGAGEKKWNEFATEINSLKWDGGNVKDPYEGTMDELNGNFNWCYYLSTNPNYRYLLHDATLLETEDEYVKEEMKKMNFWSITPYDLLNSLSEDKRTKFFDMTSFDSKEFDALFDASQKPNLIILGTNPGSDEAKIQEQKNYTKAVCEKYASSYDIFFKPHPADASSKEYETEFAEYGMKLLPKAPFEVFLWKLGDKMDIIGGYQTTSLLTCPKEKVKFLFHKGPEDLPKPLNLLFDRDDVEWMAK